MTVPITEKVQGCDQTEIIRIRMKSLLKQLNIYLPEYIENNTHIVCSKLHSLAIKTGKLRL